MEWTGSLRCNVTPMIPGTGHVSRKTRVLTRALLRRSVQQRAPARGSRFRKQARRLTGTKPIIFDMWREAIVVTREDETSPGAEILGSARQPLIVYPHRTTHNNSLNEILVCACSRASYRWCQRDDQVSFRRGSTDLEQSGKKSARAEDIDILVGVSDEVLVCGRCFREGRVWLSRYR